MRVIINGSILLCLLSVSVFSDADTKNFKPQLVNDFSPACELFEDVVQKGFLGDGHNYFNDKDLNFGGVQAIDLPADLQKLLFHGNLYRFEDYVIGGCGGACEKTNIRTSAFLPQSGEWVLRSGNQPPAASRGINYFSTEKPIIHYNGDPEAESAWGEATVEINGQIYSVSESEKSVDVYEFTPEGVWESRCRIEFPSADISTLLDGQEELLDGIQLLQNSRHMIAGGAGQNCGSMKTHWRWNKKFDDSLGLLVTRPWAMNSYHQFREDLESLDKWKLTGIDNFRVYQEFEKSLESTKNLLSGFYQSAYAWDQVKSNTVAEGALESLLGSSIRFYFYKPFLIEGEQALRKAILYGESIAVIENLPFDYESYISKITGPRSQHWADSILNIAIYRPEVMAYLLGKGIPSNSPNTFGKTPLMYAVQFDQYDAAKLLIENGADLNAMTHIPWDSCYYAINTSRYTPLIYAARYSSVSTINLLIESGASPYLASVTRIQNGEVKKPPFEWIKENKHLDDFQKKRFNETWGFPEREAAISLANKLNRQAESDYSKNNLKLAYLHLLEAHELSESNYKVSANLSLVAQKLGKFEDAYRAAIDVVESDIATDRSKANSYFNIGLIGEKYFSENRYGKLKSSQGVFKGVHVIESFLMANDMSTKNSRIGSLLDHLNKKITHQCEAIPNLRVHGYYAYSGWAKESKFSGRGTNIVVGGNYEEIDNVKEVCVTLGNDPESIAPKCFSEIYMAGNDMQFVKVFRVDGKISFYNSLKISGKSCRSIR